MKNKRLENQPWSILHRIEDPTSHMIHGQDKSEQQMNWNVCRYWNSRGPDLGNIWADRLAFVDLLKTW